MLAPGVGRLLGCALAGGVIVGAMAIAEPLPRQDHDLRGKTLLRYSCSNELGRREITLFANGTIRLREGLWSSQELYLDEMGPDEVASWVERLRQIQDGILDGAEGFLGAGLKGEWLERCEIDLAVPEYDPLHIEFSGYDLPPLTVAQLIHAAEELADYAQPPPSPDRVPGDYEPQAGDVLITAEGERFRVVRFTADLRGLELDGIEQPLRIVVAVDELSEAFVAVEPAGGR